MLTTDSTLQCVHGGTAVPLPGPAMGRVRILGKPVVSLGPPWIMQGCPGEGLAVKTSTGATTVVALPMCSNAIFSTGSMRVRTMGMPVLLQDSGGMSLPAGQPMTCVNPAQVRVRAK